MSLVNTFGGIAIFNLNPERVEAFDPVMFGRIIRQEPSKRAPIERSAEDDGRDREKKPAAWQH